MITSEVSKRYAKALYLAAKQANQQAKYLENLKTLEVALFQDKAIKAYFLNPMNSADQKSAVIKKALIEKNIENDVLNLVVLLAEKSRISAFSEIIEAYTALMDAESGVTRGVVKSAKPMTAAAIKDLESKIEGVLKKKVVLTNVEDASILGGVVAHVGGWTFDDSIETHLKKLNDELNRRAN
ncbi:MAG: ATP synthase F1 subunit delta [Bdellovibrionia bacterium]